MECTRMDQGPHQKARCRLSYATSEALGYYHFDWSWFPSRTGLYESIYLVGLCCSIEISWNAKGNARRWRIGCFLRRPRCPTRKGCLVVGCFHLDRWCSTSVWSYASMGQGIQMVWNPRIRHPKSCFCGCL